MFFCRKQRSPAPPKKYILAKQGRKSGLVLQIPHFAEGRGESQVGHGVLLAERGRVQAAAGSGAERIPAALGHAFQQHIID